MKSARAMLLLAVALVALFHCLRFRDFTVDDAGISFAYSQNFAHGHGLVATAGGERVEGYTNFLWVVLVGVGVALAGHVVVVAKVLGLLLAVATVLGAAALSAALRRRPSALDALPAALCALFTPIPYWSMSGLENPLTLALTVWGCARLVREAHDASLRPWSALFFAGVALTRPDGLVVAAAAAVAQLLAPHTRRRLWMWLLMCATPIAAHIAWRYRYYAYPWPNTFYVKASVPFRLRELFSLHEKGWTYLVTFGARYQLGVAVLLASLSLATRELRARLIVFGVLAAVLFFPLYARGDWMSEGRFAVGAMPLVFVLAVDGIENLVRLARRLPGARTPLLVGTAFASLLVFRVVPESIAVGNGRVHHYPVPVEYVAQRARRYRELATALEVARPSVADGDAGGNLLYAGMPVVDIGWLNDGTLSHWGHHPGFTREYIYGERRPTFLRLTGYWLQTHWQDYPEFGEYVHAPREGDGLYVDRGVFVVEGVDTRRPLASLTAAIDVVGWEVGPSEVRALLLARTDGPAAALALRTSASEAAVIPGETIYPPAVWRAGEVVKLRAPRPPGEVLRLCAGAACVALTDGKHGAAPVALPATAAADVDRLVARGELAAALAARARSGESTRALGAAFYDRAVRALAGGESGAAFVDFARALEADPSLAFARRRLEELRPARRPGYHPWPALRLSRALRGFQLVPSAQALSLLVRQARDAHDPIRAVRAHLATQIAPADPLALAECYLDVGLPSQAAELLDGTPAGELDLARAQRIALAAGRRDLSDRFAQANRPPAIAREVEPGIELTAAAGHLSPAGDVVLDLVLYHRDGERAIEQIILPARAGHSTVAVGKAQLALDVVPFSADFESGRLDGWTATGAAFDKPLRTHDDKELFGTQGHYYVQSADWAQGRLVTTLAAGAAEVCLAAGGGPDNSIVIEEGATLLGEQKPDKEFAQPMCFSRATTGTAWRLSVVDQSAEGGIVVDDLACFSASGIALPCAGSVTVKVE